MASANNPFGQPNSAVSDDFDMNDFVNFDQGFHNSPSPTAVKLEPHQSLEHREVMMQSSSHPRPQYNGPSHNYDQFRQQTGLPTGAISHVHAVNQFSNSNHVRAANFGTARFPGYNSGIEYGYDGQPPTEAQDFFIPGENSDDYAVDPAAIAPDSQPSTAFRAWPGMHSQQAKEQAQTEADKKKQRHEEALNSQQALPSNFEQTFGSRSRSGTETSEQQANEQISRLLNQMRQNSNASGDDDEDSKTNLAGLSSGFGRKGDDDMDEDERLLNSEEGKKLSSKERRQLRNKVSARAFRSRRKEYITQLEAEVATKNHECNDLKTTNRHLLEQNRQLTQLCKAMLSHPSFGNFMKDMSKDPSLLQAFAPQGQPAPSSNEVSATSQQQPPKQEEQQRPSSQPQQQQHQHQQDIHVGMTMMPENNLDFSMLNLGANHWTNYQQPQIFALYGVERIPPFDNLHSDILSGKPAETEEANDVVEKITAPALKESLVLPPVSLQPTARRHVDQTDLVDDPTFALYVDAPPALSRASKPADLTTALSQLEDSLSGKSSHYFHLSVRSTQDDHDTIRMIDQMFARAEPTLRRVAMATRHLDG